LPHRPVSLRTRQNENLQPGFIEMPLPMTSQALNDLQISLEAFKTNDMPPLSLVPANWGAEQWWICARANLATAEMYLFQEYSVYKPSMYENAVASARRVVDLIRSLSDSEYANLRA
jgi:hypothetical protein